MHFATFAVMNELKVTGGARIGFANATWPLVTLTANAHALTVNAGMVGNCIFLPGDVVSIRPYSGFGSSGVEIIHTVKGYSKTVIFWTSDNGNKLIDRIEDTGFFDTDLEAIDAAEVAIIREHQRLGSFPFKWSFFIALGVFWNVFFLLDFYRFFFIKKLQGIPLQYGALVAMGGMALTFVLLLVSANFRKLALKKGRQVSDIKSTVVFILIIVSLGFIMEITFWQHLR